MRPINDVCWMGGVSVRFGELGSLDVCQSRLFVRDDGVVCVDVSYGARPGHAKESAVEVLRDAISRAKSANDYEAMGSLAMNLAAIDP